MNSTESTSKYWVYFFISLVAIIIVLAMPVARPWFWLILPFVLTSFTKAMRLM